MIEDILGNKLHPVSMCSDSVVVSIENRDNALKLYPKTVLRLTTIHTIIKCINPLYDFDLFMCDDSIYRF